MSTQKTGAANARRHMAKKAEQAAPIPIDTMLPTAGTVTMAGRTFRVYPIALADKPAFDAALALLGDGYILPALAEDNPDGLTRVTRIDNPDAPTLTKEDVQTALRVMAAGVGSVQVSAMLDILELALNPIDYEQSAAGGVFDRLAAIVDGGDEAAGERPVLPRQRFVTRGEILARFNVRDFPAMLRMVMDASGLNP